MVSLLPHMEKNDLLWSTKDLKYLQHDYLVGHAEMLAAKATNMHALIVGLQNKQPVTGIY